MKRRREVQETCLPANDITERDAAMDGTGTRNGQSLSTSRVPGSPEHK
jgi:hypothetical protein